MTDGESYKRGIAGIWHRDTIGEYKITKPVRGEGPTGRERWACRNPNNQSIEEETQTLAESLVALKHLQKDLAKEEKRLKRALAVKLKQNQWAAVTYKDSLNIVEHIRTPQTRILKTKRVVSIVKDWLGEEKAAELYAIASRTPKTSSGIYVRLDLDV